MPIDSPSDASPGNASERPLGSKSTLAADIVSGIVVFLVALPLCLGIAVASGAEPFSGLLAGIVGGIVVGLISGSQTSVSGPAAGLTAIIAAQLTTLGSFPALLLAVLLAGCIQIGLGLARAGALSSFFPSSVIKGLLAAIGVILILKQIPHLVGHDTDPEGEMSFRQIDGWNTFSEYFTLIQGQIHPGSVVIGLLSLALLVLWARSSRLSRLPIPAPLLVVVLGVVTNAIFTQLGTPWQIQSTHLVQVAVAASPQEFANLLTAPDFSQWLNPGIYTAAFTIAIVASLETLLNLEAVDRLDPQRRHSPPSRELVAQGCGNIVCGLIGGLPVTSVIVRSSVNVSSGGQTRLSAVLHGFLLLLCVALLPGLLNQIPLSALAAILLVTGFKLANPQLFREMWQQGRYQFIPFIITLVAIVFSDLLIGILIGLAVSIVFILNSNLRTPIRRVVETHHGGDITHVELAHQVSFLNRAALDRIFNNTPSGSRLLIDASDTDYIDPDVLSLIRDFQRERGPTRGVQVSLRGFRDKYQLRDEVDFVDYSTRELKDQVTPGQVLEILQEGNRRFRTGRRLSRDLGSQVGATSAEQHPLALVLSCIDSRVPVELIFDAGLGDIFGVRVAGNVIGTKTLASIEYGVGVSGVKLVLVMGHTRCGAVTSAVDLVSHNKDPQQATGCDHLSAIIDEIAPSVRELSKRPLDEMSADELDHFIDQVARHNVQRTVASVLASSRVIRRAVESEQLRVIGALYDVRDGKIEFLGDDLPEN